MSDDDKSLIKINGLPGEQLYEDMVGPIASEFGEIGRSLLSFVRIPLQHGTERFETLLEDTMDDVPEDKQLSPHPAVAGPTVNNALLLPEDDPLREMFRLLLTRAINEEEQDQAHPAFARIISNLAPDEAQLLYRVYQEDEFYLTVVQKNPNFDGDVEDLRYRTFTDQYPKMAKNFVFEYEHFKWLQFPNNTIIYLDHLESLGLIQVVPVEDYRTLVCPDSDRLEAVESQRLVAYTPFGYRFHEACVPTKPNEVWGW